MYQDITGIILSGGKSTRMGHNKSFLKIGDSYIIERITHLMKSVFSKVILITNEPELYEFLEVEIYTDIYKNIGPIAGIHSGLVNSKTDRNFIISCDIPLMNKELISSIIEYPSDALITVPKADGFIQQLCGIYSKKLLPVIEKIISLDIEQENRNNSQEKRKCKIHNLIESVLTTIIDNIEDLKGYHINIFLNMNKPQDYQNILKLA
jgi:molybdopterin-guanine dinucleotide biosynthesis protein A